MIRAMIAGLALLGATQSSGAADQDAITLAYSGGDGVWGGAFEARIDANDRLRIRSNRPALASAAASPVRETVQRAVVFGYRRIAALMAPLRRWKGKTVPCDRPAPAAPPSILDLAPSDQLMVTVRWEADGAEVKVPVTCAFGPAQNDIELVRAALDDIRRWMYEGGEAEPFDGAANAAVHGEPRED